MKRIFLTKRYIKALQRIHLVSLSSNGFVDLKAAQIFFKGFAVNGCTELNMRGELFSNGLIEVGI